MATIARPAGTGASNLGAVKPIAANQDYQKLRMPDLSGGAQMRAKEAAAFGQGVSVGASALNEVRIADEKRELLKFEIAEAQLRQRLLTDPETGLGALSGQLALDRINGTPGGRPQLAGPPSLAAEYEKELNKLKEQYGASMGDKGKETLGLKGTELTTSFTGVADAAQIEAQSAVDSQLLTAKIVTASQLAVASLSEPKSTQMISRNKAFTSAKVAVTDKHVGQAKNLGYDPKSTDPKIQSIIEGLVQKQQGIVAGAMVDSLLADGKEGQAAELIDFETGPDGHITDEAEVSKLRAKLLPYREDIRAQRDFSTLVDNVPNGPNGTPSSFHIVKTIAATQDRRKRAGLESQFNKYKAVIAAERDEKVTTEMQAALKAISSGIRITPQMIPTIWLDNPILAKQLTEGGGIADPQVTEDADSQSTWESTGGGRTWNRTVDTMMKNLKVRNPATWLAVVEGGQLKGLVSLEQDTHYQGLKAGVQTEINNTLSKTGKRINFDQILTDLGIRQKARRTAIITQFGTKKLAGAVNGVVSPALKKGVEPNYNEIKAAVAAELIRVRTSGDAYLGLQPDSYHHAASREVAMMGGDPFKMRLDFNQQNVHYIAAALGIDTPAVTAALTKLPVSKHTLTDVAAHLEVALPEDPNSAAAAFDNTLHSLAVEHGLPSGFINFLLASAKKADGTSYSQTPANLVAVLNGWERRLPQGFTKKEQVIQLWLDRQR